MSGVTDTLKACIPRSLRQVLRAQHRRFVLNRALRRCSKSPLLIAHDDALLSDLIYGWGNEIWSALDEYLKACLEIAALVEGPILECGSGLSTILLGMVAQRRGTTVWALEHVDFWGARVRAYLDKFRLDSVHLHVKALRDYGDYAWYDPPAELPTSFAAVICDGPPGTTKGGRYGMLPNMRDRLAEGCVILLDDATRPDERAILEQWTQELGIEHEIRGERKPYAVLKMPKATA